MQMGEFVLLREDSPIELGYLKYVRENLEVRLVVKNTEGLAKELGFNLLRNKVTLNF